ncbi:uncharacterized protein LOC112049056 [Bicyclus anynana]|uniref:Uncharacterized protein LOC112049056 n=1 Tax=Bicyclus anynana TaxID=110368 RepID=A0A6J1N3W9_BICAN|nr:uncharacterized protein LOC112049056 [Bicyclus anynana]
MVLFHAFTSFSPSGLFTSPAKGFVIFEASYYLTRDLFAKVCKDCQDNMASIPPSAFSAGRIRETQRDMKVSKINKKEAEPTQYFRTKLMELSPLKYNSKLMNSIWGFYNRYSPHNVKKINDAFTFNEELQQSAANSSNKNEPMITLPAAKLDNVWAINVSQSH